MLDFSDPQGAFIFISTLAADIFFAIKSITKLHCKIHAYVGCLIKIIAVLFKFVFNYCIFDIFLITFFQLNLFDYKKAS